MKYKFRKIYPVSIRLAKDMNFLLIIPEGFTNEERKAFYKLSMGFSAKLLGKECLLRKFKSHEKTSINICFSVDFKNLVEINEKKMLSLNSQQVLQIFDLFEDWSSFIDETNNSLIVILKKSQNNDPVSKECFQQLDYNGIQVNVLATICDEYWEQTVTNMIGKLIGLQDESEYPGSSYLSPPSEIDGLLISSASPNLLYFNDDPDFVSFRNTKWNILSENFKDVKQVIRKKTERSPTMPDYTIPQYQYSPEKVELWEGGGGYRTKVYRSAQDCLMRRRFGDKNLSLRKEELPLCPVCEALFRQALFSSEAFNTGIITYSSEED